mmetsp:Transcript_688/g.1139  ORF Transcript_688/g.1139 Transcript_688/m.1139 type:complete len:87 (-) Transcript_688:5050-5310(-)
MSLVTKLTMNSLRRPPIGAQYQKSRLNIFTKKKNSRSPAKKPTINRVLVRRNKTKLKHLINNIPAPKNTNVINVIVRFLGSAGTNP